MSKLKAVTQKLKGKAQKAVGEFQIQSGQVVKGGISKAKGEVNERIADAKMNLENRKDRVKEEWNDQDDDTI